MISTRTMDKIAKYIHTSGLLNTIKSNSLNRLRENGVFADFEFTCDGHTIPVHRVIVCSQSPVFHAACIGKFKEASTRTYSLDSHSLPMVRRMVDFFYTGDYTGESEEDNTSEDAIPILSIHATMFALADKYNMEELRVLSAKKYSENLKKNPDVVNFLLSISEVYNSTPTYSRGLCDPALAFARERLPEFLTSSDAKEWFDEATADTPEFIKDLLYSFIQYPLMGYCSDCGRANPVPVEPLQCRCKRCGKGGASTKCHVRISDVRRFLYYNEPIIQQKNGIAKHVSPSPRDCDRR
ncbi:BTB/POZ protein [Ilyonectria robusta]|uniref:BTB/POZ protein n=1 Tax=Ilyonectria robusta TaxID=1079257 RepID=UPI001E8D0E00|nr:BTB/POZ protein [Ilyonectria robusta]KAH8658921.1 BTB/POZ protein [Ilyonectria robusta]